MFKIKNLNSKGFGHIELVLAIAERLQQRRGHKGEIPAWLRLGAPNAKAIELVKDVAMQIAAADPQFIRKEDVTPEAIEKEKEIQQARARQEGKPEKMVEKIAEGRMQKFFEEICLYEQPFIKDNTHTVADIIKSVIATLGENISVSRFVRFKVGDAAVIEETPETSAPGA